MNTNGGLHNTAYYLKGKGRGKDTELVHMTPKEVKGLQALAMAHGGSLTINPSTGLPEAGFLEDILPVVAAAGLTYLTAGAAAPTLTAALGGSAMAGGIAAGALSGAAISGGMAAVQGKDAGRAALMGGIGGGISGGLGAYDAANVFNAPNLLADASQQVVQANPVDAATMLQEGLKVAPPPDVSNVYSGLAGQPTVAPGTMPPVASPTEFVPTDPFLGSVPTYPSVPVDPAGVTPKAGTLDLVGESYAVPRNPTAMYAGAEQGIVTPSVLPQTPTPTPSYYSGLGSGAMDTAKKAAIQGLPAVAGALGSETYDDQQQLGPKDTYDSRLKRISPNFQAYEPPRPNPYYRAQYAADGGVMNSFDDENGSDVNMAGGGQVKGYAEGGMPSAANIDFGNGFNPFRNLPPMSGPLGAINPDFDPTPGFDTSVDMNIGRLASIAQSNNNFGQFTDPKSGGQNLISQKMSYPSSDQNPNTNMGSFAGSNSFYGGDGGGFGNGNSSAFPLEGQYGIVKMARGGATQLPRSSGSDPGIYKDANPTTRGQDAYTASLTNLNSLLKRANIKGLPALKAAAPPLSDIQEAAKGGVMSGLGGYSDGGRMLKGPGDGMSDSIPGVIGRKQPARLADGEFVVPADVVSHLGNGSTDAGAKRLYAMMDKIRKARTGKKKQAPAVKADRYMPA